MDAVVKPWPKGPITEHVHKAPQPVSPRPTREEAEAAVRTLIAYIGDDPKREGVLDTPKRVVGAYEELYRGYRESPAETLERTFSETAAYDDLVLVRDIGFNSHCEHHMMPFTGKAHVAYMPVDKVVGLSKLARLVDVYARRLQTQEHMNSQIDPGTGADALAHVGPGGGRCALAWPAGADEARVPALCKIREGYSGPVD